MSQIYYYFLASFLLWKPILTICSVKTVAVGTKIFFSSHNHKSKRFQYWVHILNVTYFFKSWFMWLLTRSIFRCRFDISSCKAFLRIFNTFVELCTSSKRSCKDWNGNLCSSFKSMRFLTWICLMAVGHPEIGVSYPDSVTLRPVALPCEDEILL